MISYQRLSQIIPADQALANKALAVSLQQIAGIGLTTLPTFANTVANMYTTVNLPAISSLTSPVPANIANSVANLAGTQGQPVLVCDVLGVAAGYKITDLFANTVNVLANTNTTYLTTIYQNMDSVVGNVYGDPINGPVVIPGGQPAAGTYYANVANIANVLVVVATAADNAYTGGTGDDGTGNVLPATGPGLFSVAVTELGNIVNNQPNQVAQLNSYFNSMAQQITTENYLQSLVPIDFANLVPSSQTTVFSLVYNLPYYGQQIETGGAAQFWEGVANVATFTGQAMIGAMREGHNAPYLVNAGIITNNTVPADPNPPLPQANLIPATYSAQQAANLVVK